MTRAEYEALAVRVETEEPSDDLDSAIVHAIGQQWTHPLINLDRDGNQVAPPAFTTSLDAAERADQARDAALEEAATVAENACLVPPDGGSPTDDEREMCEEAARQIRSLKSKVTK